MSQGRVPIVRRGVECFAWMAMYADEVPFTGFQSCQQLIFTLIGYLDCAASATSMRDLIRGYEAGGYPVIVGGPASNQTGSLVSLTSLIQEKFRSVIEHSRA